MQHNVDLTWHYCYNIIYDSRKKSRKDRRTKMKILVVSDTHGDFYSLNKLVQMQSNAEVVLFLGDGCEEFDDVSMLYPEKMFIGVKGNNDFCTTLPMTEERVIEGKRIFMSHGHVYGVKYGLERIIAAGKARNADIVLFGHTHEPCSQYADGMYVFNPGALHGSFGSYGVIEIQNGQILTNTAPAF